jgi:hypothetical protein
LKMKNKVWLKVLFFQIIFVVVTICLCISTYALCGPQTPEEGKILRKALFQCYTDWSNEN